jgi:hypothetical protein
MATNGTFDLIASPPSPVPPIAAAYQRCEFQGPRLEDFNCTYIGAGIGLAGAAFPILVAGTAFLLTIPLWLTDMAGEIFSGDIGMFVSLVLSMLCGAMFLAAIGLFYASFVSIFALSLVTLAAASLELRIRSVPYGAFCGGLIGFLCTSPLLLAESVDDNPIGAILVALATVVGQMGGAWGGMRTPYTAPLVEELIEPEQFKRPRFQFQIRQLLWVCVWLSLLLTVIRITGLPMGYLVVVLMVWLLFQACTLAAGFAMAKHCGTGRWAWPAIGRSTWNNPHLPQ